ncbi:sugar diacid recognition domain-containing protein [Edwardsiella tarda]|uniref:sugar diacid recognition domain-containing protein n=1 Tax=Edwardsiella tarda TaxID=636 RepID=UPI0019684D8E|nr:sugar diacid recognition domain-containing protein [Edwardsiella tarda]
MNGSDLSEAVARQIVHRAMKIIGHSVNVMDAHGMIIASGDAARVHQRHEGAVLALAENRLIEIDEAAASQLRGVRPGINLPIAFQRRVIGVVGISGAPSEVRAYGELVRMAAELIVEQAALLEQNQWEKRYRETLVQQLIADERDEAQLAATAAYLGVDVTQPRIALLFTLQDAQHETLRALLEALAALNREALIGVQGFGQLVVLLPCDAEASGADPALRRTVRQLTRGIAARFALRVYVGGHFYGSDAISRSYRSAVALQALARRHALHGALLYYHDHVLPALLEQLAGSWQADELGRAWRILQRQDSRGVLCRTLQAFFAQNCELSQTSKQLHIHVNTLRYRLQRISDITGLNINRLDDIIQLYLGMQLHG